MDSEELSVSNYCACFIDLLGQQDALRDEGLMPPLSNENDRQEFLKKVRQSVGAIETLQKQAEFLTQRSEHALSIRDQLTEEEMILYDEMKKAKVKQQRWSDGLVFYSSLQMKDIKCPMGAVFEVFLLSGALCFLGLANKQPIRGAIETAWGVELHENELYGAVVAKSYELESKVAQYPRIVVGQRTIDYLNAYLAEEANPEDKLALYNRNLAVMCIRMTAIDQDGYHILDYLGKTFTESVTHSESRDLYKMAYQYICEQYDSHRSNRNSKLALRYTWVRGYFHQNRHLHA